MAVSALTYGKKPGEYDWIVINSFNDFVEITHRTFFIKSYKKNETVAASYADSLTVQK